MGRFILVVVTKRSGEGARVVDCLLTYPLRHSCYFIGGEGSARGFAGGVSELRILGRCHRTLGQSASWWRCSWVCETGFGAPCSSLWDGFWNFVFCVVGDVLWVNLLPLSAPNPSCWPVFKAHPLHMCIAGVSREMPGYKRVKRYI